MPQNYINVLPQPDISGSLTRGVAIGGTLEEQAAKRAATQKALELQEQYHNDLSKAMSNPQPSSFASLIMKYPKQREALTKGFEILSEERKQKEILSTGQVYNALLSGKPEIALGIVDEKISAMENSGEDASQIKQLRKRMEEDPEGAAGYAGLMLSAVMKPEDFVSTFKTLREEPIELTKQQAEAKKAAVAANFAESNAVRDLVKKGWDIEKIKTDNAVAKENAKIAAAKLALEKEKNETEKQNLEVKKKELEDKRDEVISKKTAEIESSRINIDNFLSTATRILKTPMDIVGAAAGPVSAMMPTLTQDTADFEELVANLDAQAFLAQIPNMKGLGALSDAEGKKVAAALQNLSLRQSPERLIENVREAQRIMLKTREKLAEKYGVPETVPDIPEIAGGEAAARELTEPSIKVIKVQY